MTTTPARALAAAAEAVASQVYFSPEAHAEYAALGFGASPKTTRGGVALPDMPAYFCSRASSMGQVPGEVVAAVFAVFNPAVVVPAVSHGWTLTDAETIFAARTRGAVAQLERLLGPSPDGLSKAQVLLARAVERLRPEGRALYAGLSSRGLPGSPLGDAWRLADLLREYRGDAHTAAWISAGFDACEIGLVTELYWGLPIRTYVRTRAWSADELDAAEERLRSRGMLDGDGFSAAGREAREAVEVDTDRQCQPIVDALGDDLDTLVAVLNAWSASIRAGGGCLPSGPHELAAARAAS